MPPVNPGQIATLQKNSEHIRNICILAHVDHGKTSLSDCLLATNGIISPKLAGRVRYLDSRPDEQLRGITMESSAISLFFRLMRRVAEGQEPTPQEFLINLIDSPGHIDFSSEVSTASRLCDGALVLVDAVEGVCSQTVTVLRQAWIEHIRPILVINKMDRLITELQLTPGEAYTHLSKLLEQVNAVMGGFFAGERMEDDLKWREQSEQRRAKHAADVASADISADTEFVDGGANFEEKDDEDIYFAPEKNNVIFSSAIDGWAFTVKQFAAIYEKKLGFKRAVLEKVLWGDFYLDPKTKRVLGQKHLRGRALKPMFVQLVLESIWAVYDSTVQKRDLERIEKIIKSLNLKILPRELKSKDTRSLLFTIFSQWLPLSTAVLVTVIEQLPSPPAAQKQRMPLILDSAPSTEQISPELRSAMTNFDKAPEAPVVAYVSKMIAVPESELKKNSRVQLSADELRNLARLKRQQEARKLAEEAAAEGASVTDHVEVATKGTSELGLEEKPEEGASSPKEEEATDAEDKERLIGFARLYSGTVKVGQELYILGPKYDPAKPTEHIQKLKVTELYYLMGRDLQFLDEVPAGNVFGIGGLEGKLFKNGTLCSLPQGGANLAGISMGGAPIVRVALEPKNPSELQKMVEGLKLLEQADPCAEYLVQSNGEHLLLAAGELHLERCLKDLRERFAKIDIQASAPIVPFRESIAWPTAEAVSTREKSDLPLGTVVASTPSKSFTLRLHARPLPPAVTEYLVENSLAIKKLYTEHKERTSLESRQRGEDDSEKFNEEAGPTTAGDAKSEVPIKAALDENDAMLAAKHARVLSLNEFKKGLQELFDKEAPPGEKEVWAGVVDRIAAFGPRRIGPNILVDATGTGLLRPLLSETPTSTRPTSPTADAPTFDATPHIHHTFQLVTSSGPLCAEPLQGTAFILETLEQTNPITDETPTQLRASLLSLLTTTLRKSLELFSPRLLTATYHLTLLLPPSALGKLYPTITKRRGKILSEELREGTPFFTVTALVPVVESFGFSDDVRKRTSGEVSVQIRWGGYKLLVDEDPFWVPRTEEEIEDWGEEGTRGESVVRRWVEDVRKRKGLFVQGRKLVGRAEGQRTLKR